MDVKVGLIGDLSIFFKKSYLKEVFDKGCLETSFQEA